mgnify:CR=1 FL=1
MTAIWVRLGRDVWREVWRDLRDAELARLELLNEALDPLFAEIPPDVELFDRGISRGDTPRLWCWYWQLWFSDVIGSICNACGSH